MSEEKLIGEVMHYYPEKSMAFLAISDCFSAGQTLHIKGPETEVEQAVDVMLVAQQEVHEAYPDDFVGIHVEQEVHEHDKVFLEV